MRDYFQSGPTELKIPTPVWLIGPNVSNAAGWNVMVSGNVMYLAVFLSAAILLFLLLLLLLLFYFVNINVT